MADGDHDGRRDSGWVVVQLYGAACRWLAHELARPGTWAFSFCLCRRQTLCARPPFRLWNMEDRNSGRILQRHHVIGRGRLRSEEHTSELQSLMRISYAVFCLKKKKEKHRNTTSEKQA